MPAPQVIRLPARPAAVAIAPAPAHETAYHPGRAEAAAAEAARQALEDGRAALDAERRALADARRALEDAAQQIDRTHQAILAAAESQLADLALVVAQKVLAHEITDGRHRIEPLVREVLRHLPTRRDVTVHLNPLDLAAWPQGPDAAPMPTNLRLVPDAGLKRGECLAETAEGVVSATVAERLGAAANAIHN